MPMQWNDQADARLFANVLKLHVVKLDYAQLAKAMGNGVTPKAISHRIAKIKDKANAYVKANPYAFDDLGSGKKSGKKGVKGTGMKIGTGLKRKINDMDDDDDGLVKKEVKMEVMEGEEMAIEGMNGMEEGSAYAAATEEGLRDGDIMNGVGDGDSMRRAQDLLVGRATLTEEQRVWALREGGYLRCGNETAAVAEEETQVQMEAVQTKAFQLEVCEPLMKQSEPEPVPKPAPEPAPVDIGMANNGTSMVLVMENASVVDSLSGSSS
ncbi:hypothetical protein BZA77DRAFT_346528 [Pyronema omphalodes]|nr:hypothetical protein BZA77DRAFT_346528 [Pyronema omphalodes]